MNTDRKILILTADAGFGHRSAANAVHEALIETYGKHAQVEIVNPLEDRRTPFFLRESQTDYDIIVRNLPELYRFGYDASDATLPTVIFERALTVLLYEVLHDILKKHQPDAILTTYPLYQVPVQAIFTIQRYSIPFLTAVTDLATVHRIWFHAGVHALLVPNEQVRDLALTYHVPAKKIHITGIPVHPVLAHEQRPKAEIRASLGWQPDLPTLLAVGSRRVGGMPEILNVINHFGTRLQMAVVAGKDEQLFEQLQHTEWHQPVHLFEYADNMPTLMSAADAIICKAGGLIVTESLAAGLPLMLIDVIPGQETGNAEYVTQNGAGDLAQTPMEALEILAHWFMDGGAGLAQRANNACQLGKPNSAIAAAKLVWQAAAIGPTSKKAPAATRARLIDLLKLNHIDWQETLLQTGKKLISPPSKEE